MLHDLFTIAVNGRCQGGWILLLPTVNIEMGKVWRCWKFYLEVGVMQVVSRIRHTISNSRSNEKEVAFAACLPRMHSVFTPHLK